MSFLNYR